MHVKVCCRHHYMKRHGSGDGSQLVESVGVGRSYRPGNGGDCVWVLDSWWVMDPICWEEMEQGCVDFKDSHNLEVEVPGVAKSWTQLSSRTTKKLRVINIFSWVRIFRTSSLGDSISRNPERTVRRRQREESDYIEACNKGQVDWTSKDYC